MKMKLLGLLIAVGIMALGSNALYADINTAMSTPVELHKKIVIYDAPLSSNLDLDVLTNQVINFEFQNRSHEDVIFEIPSKNLLVEIPKSTTKMVKVTMSDPIDKNVYFRLCQSGSNLKPGTFHVTDYRVTTMNPTITSYSISDAELRRLTQLSSSQQMVSEEEITTQKKITTQEEETIQTERYIRGYW